MKAHISNKLKDILSDDTNAIKLQQSSVDTDRKYIVGTLNTRVDASLVIGFYLALLLFIVIFV